MHEKREKGEVKSAVGAYASYSFDYRYKREYFGTWRGDYSVGFTVFAKYYPYVYSDGAKDVGYVGVNFDFLRAGE